MEIIKVSELPSDAKVSDYHRDQTEYFIQLMVFGRNYYIPLVEKMEKLFKIKDGKARDHVLINDIFQVIIASVYYQLRDTVGEEIFRKLAAEIEDGFRSFFNDGLSNLIEEKFQESERNCTTCLFGPTLCKFFHNECHEENGYPKWEAPSPLFLKKVAWYGKVQVYTRDGRGFVKGLVPDLNDHTRVVLTVKIGEKLKDFEEGHVIRIVCTSCKKNPCGDKLFHKCVENAFMDWELKEERKIWEWPFKKE